MAVFCYSGHPNTCLATVNGGTPKHMSCCFSVRFAKSDCFALFEFSHETVVVGRDLKGQSPVMPWGSSRCSGPTRGKQSANNCSAIHEGGVNKLRGGGSDWSGGNNEKLLTGRSKIISYWYTVPIFRIIFLREIPEIRKILFSHCNTKRRKSYVIYSCYNIFNGLENAILKAIKTAHVE